MADIREAIRDYGNGNIHLGQPPSDCYSECPVMQLQVPDEQRNSVLTEKLGFFRLAVAHFAEIQLRSKLGLPLADKPFPGYVQELSEADSTRATQCGIEVVSGTCQLLDIVVRDMNGITVFTTNDTSLGLLRKVRTEVEARKPKTDEGVFIDPENIHADLSASVDVVEVTGRMLRNAEKKIRERNNF